MASELTAEKLAELEAVCDEADRKKAAPGDVPVVIDMPVVILSPETCRALIAAARERDRLRELLAEALSPDVFGPWGNVEDSDLKHTNLRDLCERHGYGAVMHYTEYLWRGKAAQNGHPGSEHTCAACASVRRSFIARATEALASKENPHA